MKKKIIAVIGILVILIIACIAKFAFVKATDEKTDEKELSSEEIVELSRKTQPIVDGKYTPLGEDEIKNFEKVFKKGDVNNDGVMDTDDAIMALEIYSDCILIKYRNETKGEIFRADVDGDNVVTLSDALTLLMFMNEVSLDETKTLTLENYLNSNLKAE